METQLNYYNLCASNLLDFYLLNDTKMRMREVKPDSIFFHEIYYN